MPQRATGFAGGRPGEGLIIGSGLRLNDGRERPGNRGLLRTAGTQTQGAARLVTYYLTNLPGRRKEARQSLKEGVGSHFVAWCGLGRNTEFCWLCHGACLRLFGGGGDGGGVVGVVGGVSV